MSPRPLLALLLALALPAAAALAEEAPEKDAAKEEGARSKPTADEEIEALVGPTHEEKVVVTASRREESVLDAPVSVTVVGEQQVETSAADNVADLLRGVPGLNATQTSARQISVATRTPASALANSQLVLIDGRSIYQDFFGLVMWDVLPVQMDELKQVEVLRGPGSAVWGANALSGVVNARTKTPRELEGGLVWAHAGEQGTRAGGFRWAQAWERFSWKISTSWFEQEPWERENVFYDGTPIPDSFQFDNEGTEQPKIDLRLDYERDGKTWGYRAGHGATAGIMHTGIGPFQVRKKSYMQYLDFSYEDEVTQAKLYVNRLDGEALNLLNGLEFLFATDTFVGEISQQRELAGRHRLVYGGNLRSNKFDLSLAPGENERLEAGAFLEDRVALNERWSLNGGLRVDYSDTIGYTLSPRTSLIYKPTPRQSWRLAYNRAFRAPSLVNNYLDTAVPNLAILPNGNQFVFVTFAQGDEDLKEETVDAFELGWTGIVGTSMISAAIYRNVTSELIDFAQAEYYSAEDPPNGLRPEEVPERELVKTYRYRNVGETVDEGLELSVETWWGRGVLTTASYTWQNPTKVTEDDPIEPLIPNLSPRHQLSLGVSWQGPRYQGSFSASWTDQAFFADVLDDRFWGETEDYWLLNASFGAKFLKDSMEVKLSATNLLDDPIKQHVFGDIIRRKATLELRYRF